MVQLVKRYPFSASHRLYSPELSEEENRRLFDKCANPFGHGHNYVLEVGVIGPVDAESGMVLPREALNRFVEKHVLSKIDHADLNKDVPDFQDRVPTTENLSLLVEQWLRQPWEREFGNNGLRLAKVRLEETARNTFEVKN